MRISDWSSDVCSSDLVEALYEAEEALVRGHWDDTRRLNMIPGGRAGYRYLRRAGLVDPGSEDMPDDRDQAVSNWLGRNPDRPLPDRKSTRLNSSHSCAPRLPPSACKIKKHSDRWTDA